MLRYRMPTWAKVALAGVGIAAAMAGGLYWGQSALLYHPSVPGMPTRTEDNPARFRSPARWGLQHREAYVTKTGERLHTWLMMNKVQGSHGSDASKPHSVPTVIFFHGNAANMGWRLPFAKALMDTCECNMVMTDYRGYGMSSGSPEEEGIAKDAHAVLEWTLQQPEVDPRRVFVYGRSLGGAVAFRLAHERPNDVAGVIAENTFLSISAMVNHLFPALAPFKWLLTLRFATVDRAPHVVQPALLISGQRDTLVPPYHMKKLAKVLRKRTHEGATTELFKVRHGEHDDTWEQGGHKLSAAVAAFLHRHSRL